MIIKTLHLLLIIKFKQSHKKLSEPSQIEKSIIDLHCIRGLKKSLISNRLRISRKQVNEVISQTRTETIRLNSIYRNTRESSSKINTAIYDSIKKFWQDNQNKKFTIQQIINQLNDQLEAKSIPWATTIRNFIKLKLRLNYKRVSWRPQKVANNDFVSKRILL